MFVECNSSLSILTFLSDRLHFNLIIYLHEILSGEGWKADVLSVFLSFLFYGYINMITPSSLGNHVD